MSFIHQNRKNRGFTLVELLVVITIIGILAGLATGAAIYVRGQVIDTMTKAQLSQMDIALEAYKAEFGEYPPTLGDFDKMAVNRHAASRWKKAKFGVAPGAFANYDVDKNGILDAHEVIQAVKDFDHSSTLTFWLGGRYDSDSDSYVGFSANLENPLGMVVVDNVLTGFVLGGQRTESRFDFSDKNTVLLTDGRYFAVFDKPVAYFRSKASGDTFAYLQDPDADGKIYPLCDQNLGEPGNNAVPYAKSATKGGQPFNPALDDSFGWTASDWASVKVVWQGAKKYQLIHPGRDSDFGALRRPAGGAPNDPTTFFASMFDGTGISLEDENNVTSFTSTATLKGELNQ